LPFSSFSFEFSPVSPISFSIEMSDTSPTSSCRDDIDMVVVSLTLFAMLMSLDGLKIRLKRLPKIPAEVDATDSSINSSGCRAK
uniref:Secreted protein n=1 Tax=Brugia timori TaxID=42155 RepID=A0A0R3QHJ5_9BILA